MNVNNYVDMDEYLVSMVRNYPELYSKDHEYYRDDERKRATWTSVGKFLEMDMETVKKRWENLRDRFVRTYREYCDRPAAEAEIVKSKFRLFEKMLWLSPYIRKRKITSTVAASRKKMYLQIDSSNIEDDNTNVQSNETQDSFTLKRESQSPTSSEISIHKFEADEVILSSTSNNKPPSILPTQRTETDNKSDHYFMMAVIQECQYLPPRKKLKFKRDVLELLEKYLYEEDAS